MNAKVNEKYKLPNVYISPQHKLTGQKQNPLQGKNVNLGICCEAAGLYLRAPVQLHDRLQLVMRGKKDSTSLCYKSCHINNV